MHPILFRIPLPHRPLMLWWALAIGAVVAVAYAVAAVRSKEPGTAVIAGGFAVGAVVLAYVYRASSFEAQTVPIYSYGVMLGLSLVAGWYLTLTLADKDGLPKETMANCYVFTAVAAIAGSRVLYVLTNLDEFHSLADIFAFRRGGLVAYGGFIGGYLGSWTYLQMNRLRLMPWADVAVPSLASGLLITRLGCYMFGCDFGKRLPESAPHFLQKLGTFPHWAQGTLDSGDGSPAFVRHLELYRGTDLGKQLLASNASFPVHPTQLYESLCGLVLLSLLLWQRKSQRFRGQIFFTFAFGYGFLRFLLEILRDDVERGEYGPMLSEHVLVPGALFLMAMGFCFGIALGIRDKTMRTLARVLSFLPALVAYLALKPPSFGNSVSVQLSTSQWIGLLSALLVSYFYAQFWEEARRNPAVAMNLASLGPAMETAPEPKPREREDDDAEPAEEPSEADAPDITVAAAPSPKKKRKKASREKRPEASAAKKGEDAGEDEAEGAAPAAGVVSEKKTESEKASTDEAKP